MRLRWLLMGLITLLVACAAPSGNPVPQSWVADPNNGELVIYRTRSLVFLARSTYFYVDGVHVASLGSASYAVIKIPPGSHRLTQKWDWDMMAKDMEINVEVVPRQRRYVRLLQSGSNAIYSSPTVFQFGWQLATVPENAASVEIQGLEAKPPINTAAK